MNKPIRIHVICEGQTEEMFINEVMNDSFSMKNIMFYPSLIGKVGHKGGNFKVERLLPDIKKRLLSDPSAYCTTFFDFYGLPKDFPGKEEAKLKNNISDKSKCICDELNKRVTKEVGETSKKRFIPYVQMYEFEGLLFADPEKIVDEIQKDNLKSINDLKKSFLEIRKNFKSPEEINNHFESAPSKRIKKLLPSYQKPSDGLMIAVSINLNNIRRECQLFNSWLNQLESLQAI